MIKVIINSYTCCPGMGSEQGMGWNWITSLAKAGCELFVITEGEYRSTIEEWIASEKLTVKSEKLAFDDPRNYAARLHFYWNPIGGEDEARCAEIRKMCWNQGDWRFYKYYRQWQMKTAEIARTICKEQKIDILHQLNMIGFREPGYLWQVSKETGIPFVWGPADAKDEFPLAYCEGAGLKTKAFLWLKNTITKWQLGHDKRVLAAAKQACVLLGASSNSVRSFKKYMGLESILMNETGCKVINDNDTAKAYDDDNHKHSTINHKPFNILWVGKMDFRKQLGLALKTIATAYHEDIRLHVLGGGDAEPYKQMAAGLGIEGNVVWHGAISHAEVQKLMQKCQLMLFTSVAEGTPHVVLEAIANGLPVVCHDTCGHGDSVTPEVGVKIPVKNPSESVRDFASAIERVYKDRELLAQMSHNCPERALELSWENKAKEMVELYEEVIKNRKSHHPIE